MFTRLSVSQNLADHIKGFIKRANVSEPLRDIVMRTLKEFEKQPWAPLLLEKALEQHPKLTLPSDPTEGTVQFDGSDEEALAAIDGVLRDYRALLNPYAKEYTAEEAATEIGISLSQFNDYASRRKVITGRRVGWTILYSEEEVQRLKTSRKPKGRPKKNVEPNE